MTQEELDSVIANHQHWLKQDCDGWEKMRANLYSANLDSAKLKGANLYGAKNIPYIPLSCPSEGAFIGWKKASDNRIVKLEIPADARRTSATTRKCRCNKALVLEIQNADGSIAKCTSVRSNHDRSFVYKVGKTVKVDNFEADRWKECAPGIHFFINRQDAVDYY